MTTTSFAAVRLRPLPLTLTLSAQLGLLLLCHVVIWTWAGWSSRSNFDVPGDMVEAYAWAQGWQWGYYKHPPLSAWLVGLWFAWVPESQFGYSLLAALNSALGLAGLALLAREFLPGRWVLLAVALASLAPGVTTLAMRFNANAVLVSTWPWALALFVRLMQRGRNADALACGAACALALLGKYYSAVLLLTLLCTACALPVWRRRLRSRSFALALAAFALIIAPHALWLLAQSRGPLQYAQAATGHEGCAASTQRALQFALVQCLIPLLACGALRLALGGPQRHRALWQAVTAALRPRREATWLLAVSPIAFTMVATVATGARTASVWGVAIAGGLMLLAACRARETGATLSLRRLWCSLGAVWLLVAIVAPLWWTACAVQNDPSLTEPREELALAVDRAWQAEFGARLPWISGTRALAASVAFYAPSHPHYWSLWNRRFETPWARQDDILGRGGAIVCASTDRDCQALARAWSTESRTHTVAKSAHGFRFDARSYVVYWLTPVDPVALH